MNEALPGDEWVEYYQLFPYFSHEKIRHGCYPWKMICKDSTQSIVLVHGLSDSPYYMLALAEYFYKKLSYSVFIPLLQCHGLKHPDGMRQVSLEEWKKNVMLSVAAAAEHGTVSIGGLSTGGTLGVYAMEKMSQPIGCLYLFSPALALSGGVIGRFKEWVVRTRFADFLRLLDRNTALVGKHPYRYAYVDMGATRELSHLIREVSEIIENYSEDSPYPHCVYAVHHENDRVVSFAAVQDFLKRTLASKSGFLPIPRDVDVAHAGVVLQYDILSEGEDALILEKSNPLFQKLLSSLDAMQAKIAAEDTVTLRAC